MSSRIFFTADTHFSHHLMVKHRGFSSAEAHDHALISTWNSVITSGDRVYHLGDVGLGKPAHISSLLAQLNGQLYLIRGNHDSQIDTCAKHFIWIKDCFELLVSDEDAPRGRQSIWLAHYAHRVWPKSHYGAWHLYGHSHGNLESLPDHKSFDIGVDCWDLIPQSYEQIKAIMFA